jgi:hypothetical protein
MKKYGYLGIIIFLAFSGCCPRKTLSHNQEAKYYSLSSPLTQLSGYGEVYLRYGNPPAELPESEFIANSAAHDTDILTIFKDYELHVQRGKPFVGILICEKEKKKSYAVMEDYSCTAKLDKQAWKETPHSPCQFTAQIDAVCPPEGAQP